MGVDKKFKSAITDIRSVKSPRNYSFLLGIGGKPGLANPNTNS